MSISAINWALKAKTGSPTAKLVLIKLADNADDEGRCYPSRKNISEQCELSVATVSRTIKKLEDSGHITVIRETFDGVKQRNRYRLNLRLVGAQCADGRRTESLGVGAECASEPPIEPPENLLTPAASPREILALSVGGELADEIFQFRKKIKAPNTERAIRSLCKGFSGCRDGPVAAAEMLLAHGWRGFQAEWYDNAKRDSKTGTGDEGSRYERFLRNGNVREAGVHAAGGEPDHGVKGLKDRRGGGSA